MCNKCDHKDHHKDHHKCDHKDHDKCHESCVEEILEAILKAQRKADGDDGCRTSCKESIKELLGESKKWTKNTIPFILYCGDCAPFKASGATTILTHHKKKKFVCITSFIFRIKDIKDSCAVLELLTFKSDKKCEKDSYKRCDETCSPCCQIDHKDVDDLVKTGICINVDLSCFCAVTCLPAVHL
ncbi:MULTISPECIES: CotY/CotZ family spore coat protein [Metabacillus]|uniref:Spore coat protein n=2 Tax=Metabacillus TaxID=2675233 RepID=A0A179SU84_9BACI|nr:CotY/CotZ family spore coat protein [Metabacillus litoralis]OAS83832.1 spore coat protein [Metabacillus litoralis]